MPANGSTDPSARPDHESVRLESWKEIAAYLNRSVTSVQRWEQEEGLPVHRLVHAKGGSVYALTHELDLWRNQRDALRHSEDAVPLRGETLELESGPIFSAPAESISAERALDARVHRERRGFVARLSHRPWLVSLLALVTLAGLATLLPWPVASARILSVRPLVADLERFGGRLRTGEACDNPYANWSWASDHERVYFAMPRPLGQGATDSYALHAVPIAGGEPVEIPLRFPYEVRILDYVPEQSALLVTGASEPRPIQITPSELPLWLVSTAGAAPRRIPNLLGNWGDVAADGKTLAFLRHYQEGRSRLFLAQLDGSTSRDLGTVPADVIRPRWAPDGSRLRFFRRGASRNAFGDSIWERGLGRGAPRALWPGSRGDWTPDGRYFVYDREDPGAFRLDLFAQRERNWLDFRTKTPERLTVGPMSFWAPGVSRDGRQLFAFGRLGRGEMMRLDPKTKALVPALGGESAIYVEPSPDGEWLVWVRYPEGTLWKGRADGSQRQPLTSKPLEAHLPRWSPDGQTIVFAGRTPDEPQLGIYRVAADGSANELLVRSPKPADNFWDPCWRRDGTLVFSLALSRRPASCSSIRKRGVSRGCRVPRRCVGPSARARVTCWLRQNTRRGFGTCCFGVIARSGKTSAP